MEVACLMRRVRLYEPDGIQHRQYKQGSPVLAAVEL